MASSSGDSLERAYLDAGGPSEAGLKEALIAMYQAGGDAFPGLSLEPETFGAYLARVGAPLLLQRAADLWIACACADGHPGALAALDRDYLSRIEHSIERARGSIPLDEVRQALRTRLFLAEGRTSAHIASYAGKADLMSWLRVVAVRLTRDLGRSRRVEVPLEQELERVLVAPGDAELDALRRTAQAAFREAFKDALAKLDDRAKGMLRHYYLDGLKLAALATRYGMHVSNVSRAMQRARDELLRHTRAALAEQLRLSSDELDSLMRLLGSRLDNSLGMLRSAGN